MDTKLIRLLDINGTLYEIDFSDLENYEKKLSVLDNIENAEEGKTYISINSKGKISGIVLNKQYYQINLDDVYNKTEIDLREANILSNLALALNNYYTKLQVNSLIENHNKHVVLSLDKYESLDNIDDNTFYFIKEDDDDDEVLSSWTFGDKFPIVFGKSNWTFGNKFPIIFSKSNWTFGDKFPIVLN